MFAHLLASTNISTFLEFAGACSSDTPLDASTRLSVEVALTSSADPNPWLRDVDLSADGVGSCTATHNGVSTKGAQITINGSCWQHVHPDDGNVHAFSYWRLAHPGLVEAVRLPSDEHAATGLHDERVHAAGRCERRQGERGGHRSAWRASARLELPTEGPGVHESFSEKAACVCSGRRPR